MTSAVGDSHLPESLSGPCGWFRYHELNRHKVTKCPARICRLLAAAAPSFTNILSDSRRTTRSLSPTTIADERARGESLASKRGTKCTQKRPCPEMHGFCNFALFVHQKSKAPERVKRDPHLFDLVIFLHPKKCLTCGCTVVLRSFWFGNGPRNLCLVVFWTSNGIFRTEILE